MATGTLNAFTLDKLTDRGKEERTQRETNTSPGNGPWKDFLGNTCLFSHHSRDTCRAGRSQRRGALAIGPAESGEGRPGARGGGDVAGWGMGDDMQA